MCHTLPREVGRRAPARADAACAPLTEGLPYPPRKTSPADLERPRSHLRSDLVAEPASPGVPEANRHVHILRSRREPFVVDGLPGRVLSEVAACSAPVGWAVVAREIWGATEDLTLLRQSWDRAMRRLRARLREGGVREDLVRPDGCGNVELVLGAADTVVDEG